MIERSGRDGRQPRPANRPAVPAPTPPGSAGSTLRPPFQARAPVFFLFQPQAQATDRPAGQWQQLLELFPNTLPLPSRWVCTVCRHRLESRSVSAFPPSPLTLSSWGTKCSPLKKDLPLRMAPYFSQLNKPISLFSSCQPFCFSENVGSPNPYIQKQAKHTLVLNCF